jgi:hypothetical protein|tara:strand:- start:305 stop:535 length:231 start_codon:yes stop_codon:yes gene_type:complete
MPINIEIFDAENRKDINTIVLTDGPLFVLWEMVDIFVKDYPSPNRKFVKAYVDAAKDKMDKRRANDPFNKMSVIQP